MSSNSLEILYQTPIYSKRFEEAIDTVLDDLANEQEILKAETKELENFANSEFKDKQLG